jgi:hypothetical protein
MIRRLLLGWLILVIIAGVITAALTAGQDSDSVTISIEFVMIFFVLLLLLAAAALVCEIICAYYIGVRRFFLGGRSHGSECSRGGLRWHIVTGGTSRTLA